MTDADIRFALYLAFLFAALEGFVWCLRIGSQPDAPRVTRPMGAMLLGLGAACVALASAQGLQSWNMARYFDFVDYIRWGLIGSVGLALAAFYWWRLGWYYDAVRICIFGIEFIIRACRPRTHGELIFGPPVPESLITGGITTMSTLMNTNQKVSVRANFRDDEGNPTTPSSVTWASDSPAVAQVTSDGTIDAVVATGPGTSELGAAVITATSDNGTVLSGVVEVSAGETAAGELAFGTPEAEDAEPTP